MAFARHLSREDQNNLIVELVCNEAIKTSAIEGEFLDRESLQSSIRREFGLGIADHHRIKPAEAGIAEMMKDIFTNYESPLTEKTLYNWHEMLMSGRRNIEIGKYRTHKEAMQVVSGRHDKPKVHFEAPPSVNIPNEMEKFIDWFNNSAPVGKEPLTPLVRAGIAHIYFVSIHPIFDGNGRTSRLLMNVLLMQKGFPLTIILKHDRKKYYRVLAQADLGNFRPLTLFIAQAVERTLDIYLKTLTPITENREKYLSLSDLAEHTPYSAKYLNLLVRKGKLAGHKEGRIWLSTINAVDVYIKNRKRQV